MLKIFSSTRTFFREMVEELQKASWPTKTELRDSTIVGNDSPYGGGIAVLGATATISGSTISGNDAAQYGGGINTTSATLNVEESTISGNDALSIGGGIRTQNSPTDPVVTNTIVANNTAPTSGPDLAGVNDSFSIGFSLIENASGVGINQTGPNITGQDPQLGALAPNGGPTPTLLPAITSPLVDRIPAAACQTAPLASGITTDQRGLPRAEFVGGACDIGAVELQPAPPPVITPTFTG